MKKYLFLLLLTVSAFNSNAQMINLDWAGSIDANSAFGWDPKHIAIDNKKNVYIASTNKSSADLDPGNPVYLVTAAGLCNAFICKLDSFGNFVWGKTFGGPRYTYISKIAVDTFGNVYSTGMFSGTVDFDPGPGNYSLTVQGGTPEPYGTYISKLDSNGNFLWAKQIGEIGGDVSRDMVIDDQANIYIVGYSNGNTDMDPGPGVFYIGGTGNNGYVLKLNTDGNFEYCRAFTGGISIPNNLRLDKNKNIYLNGKFNGIVDYNPGPAVYNLIQSSSSLASFFVKLDSLGNFIWATKDIGSSAFDVDEWENIYTITINSSQGWLKKCNPTGNQLWYKAVGGWPENDNQTFTIEVDDYNDIYITGTFTGTKDFDPGPAVFNMTASGTFNMLMSDIFVSRLDKDANFKWATSFGSYAADFGMGIAVDDDGSVYSTGRYVHAVDFDPGPGVFNLSPWPSYDGIYVLKLFPCLNRSYQTINISACHSYTLNGTTYNKTGTYKQKIMNAQGCDSIITLNLSINGYSDTTTATVCDSYVWNGQTYNATGIYSDTLIGTTGCDSIISLDLIIKPKSFHTVNQAICEGDTFEGYNTSGTYYDTLVAANGCDSIRTLHLLVKEKRYSDINAVVCEGESYLGYSTAGTHVDTLVSSIGCDSIRRLHLVVNKAYIISIEKSICEDEQFLGHNTSGNYIDTLQTIAGCDSIIKTNLKVEMQPRPYLGIDTSICTGSSITLNPGQFNSYLWQDGYSGNIYTAMKGGVYNVTVSNSCGSKSASIKIEEISCQWYFPNVFTPNLDGRNDVFKIINAHNLLDYHFTIFNRYGQLVFETKDYRKGWDGTFGNTVCVQGAYVWICSFKEHNKSQRLKGTVLLLR